MTFPEPLIHGRLVKRYKRFLADILLDNGNLVTAHCTNSGSMKSCLEEYAEVFISPSSNPNRKLAYTWEMIRINNSWVGINTSNPNRIAYEILEKQWIDELPNFKTLRREVKYDDSRFDIYGETDNQKWLFEVKNVTLKEGRFAQFPDAVTTRGQKHLSTLIKAKADGYHVAMIYIIQRTDVEIFAPAWRIDPVYAKELIKAFDAGVKLFAVQVDVTPESIEPLRLLPIDLIQK
ncbi:MAG TPA: DNA/RNA nuclease SfsA [Bacteroidales bacterium]|nr:DNA/RNA nuclease SfsA [Bacteroidales bacterium]